MNRIPNRIETVDDDVAEVLRRKTPAERLAIAHGMWSFARSMLLSSLRGKHPDWTEQRLHEEAARRMSHGAG